MIKKMQRERAMREFNEDHEWNNDKEKKNLTDQGILFRLV